MKKGTWFINASIVLSDALIHGSVYVNGNTIANIVEGDQPLHLINEQDEVIDAKDMLLLPGLIDIHCDAIEKEVQPRPNVLFPMELALYELEKKLAGNGITTMYQSISLGVGLSLRGDHLLVNLIDLIHRYQSQRSMIRHRVHLRYELIHLEGLALAENLIRSGKVQYVSIMNHAPGQGQYRAPGSFEAYVMKNQGVNKEEAQKIAENAVKLQETIDWAQVRSLITLAGDYGIPVASHDDDSIGLIDDSLRYGVSISEFPLNIETACYAKENKLHVCVGAPNVVRGGSHDKNMRAIDAINAGYVNIICSDYLPSSMLSAIFTVADKGTSLPDAVNMASLNPAIAMGIDHELGSIACGKSADLVLVKLIDEYPFIAKTYVDGICVYSADFYFQDMKEGRPEGQPIYV